MLQCGVYFGQQLQFRQRRPALGAALIRVRHHAHSQRDTYLAIAPLNALADVVPVDLIKINQHYARVEGQRRWHDFTVPCSSEHQFETLIDVRRAEKPVTERQPEERCRRLLRWA